MALTLVKEDGTGADDANSYEDAAGCTAYHEGHLYATAWTGASAGQKDAALVMATRLIDVEMQFGGRKAVEDQGLQWPRLGCIDLDAAVGSAGVAYVPDNVVPPEVIAATCETARALLIEDRTANPVGEGVRFQTLGDLQQSFDKADRRPVLPRLALTMLRKFGLPMNAGSGAVRLVRT